MLIDSGDSALELVAKFADAEFMRRAKATNFVGRAWAAMAEAGAGDKVWVRSVLRLALTGM